jgi:hypothetical protein
MAHRTAHQMARRMRLLGITVAVQRLPICTNGNCTGVPIWPLIQCEQCRNAKRRYRSKIERRRKEAK